MTRGLEGRRIALAIVGDDSTEPRASVVRQTLEQAGGQVDVLKPGQGADADWHGGRFAALVAVGDGQSKRSNTDARLVQLAREFLVSQKPVAAIGDALDVIIEAGGTAADCLVTAQGSADSQEFADRVVVELSGHLEERQVDEMSEESFPASDPPSTTPASTGHVAPERDRDARP